MNCKRSKKTLKTTSKKKLFSLCLWVAAVIISGISCAATADIDESKPMNNLASHTLEAREEYVDFFEKVYDTMDQNYYYPVSRDAFDRFVLSFEQKIFPQLKTAGKSVDYIKWRSSAYLVDALKSREDVFSAFMPPKFAKKYETEVLGKKIDLGIEGELTDEGYRVVKIEPRSDAFEKGLRENDFIVSIDGVAVRELTPQAISDRLVPLENAVVTLEYLDAQKLARHTIEAVSKEYFKQTVFLVPVDVPGVYCLRIQRFNRMTGEDLTRFMMMILQKGNPGLIIDLRGNPGGPPLAAREISSFFLTPHEDFAYFKWKNKPNATLDVPQIPDRFRFHGPMAILVDKESGSASELFSGIMQWRGRAAVIGTHTAGQVFLKSMFNFDDESMLLLVTARGHRPDGQVFSFQGVVPNITVDPQEDMVRYAAQFLVDERKRRTEP